MGKKIPRIYTFTKRRDRGKRPPEELPGPPCETLVTMSASKRKEMIRLYGPLSAGTSRRLAIADRVKKARRVNA